MPRASSSLEPRGLIEVRSQERPWSEGSYWRLIPKPAVPLRVVTRVGENFVLRAIPIAGRNVEVIWLPHAVGSDVGSEIAARIVAARGWGVLSLLPPAKLPANPMTYDDWASLLEERVRLGRAAVAMARESHARCVAVMGVSAGGIAALRTTELEPDVNAAVGMLVGGGNDALVHAARAYGASGDPTTPWLRLRLEALDPARHAGAMEGRTSLLVRGVFDDLFPANSFEDLRVALDHAATHHYATGHESFAYMMPWAVERALRWIERRCALAQP